MSIFDKLLFWRKEENISKPGVPDLPPQIPRGPAPPPQNIPDYPEMGREPGFESDMPQPMPRPAQPMPSQSMPEPGMGGMPASRASRPEALQEGDQHSLINAKLDTIKAQLDTVIQRLDRIERGGEERSYQRRWR